MDALQRGHVHEPGAVAHDHPAGEVEAVGQGEEPAFRDRLRTPGDARAAFQDAPDELMALELLEQIVDGKGRIGVVESDHHSQRHHRVPQRVDEAPTELSVLAPAPQRPPHGVDDALERSRHLPDLLDPERPHLGLRRQRETRAGDAGQMALRPLGQDRHARPDVRARLEVRELFPVAAAATVARADPDDTPAGYEQLPGGRLGNDRDAELLRALGEPAAHLREGRDVVAVIPHCRGRRDAQRALGGEVVEALVHDRATEGHVLRVHAGEELAKGPRVDDGAGEEMCAGCAAFLHHCDRHLAEAFTHVRALLEELGQANCRREASRPSSHDESADVDPLLRRIGWFRDELLWIEGRRKICGPDRHCPRFAFTSSVSFGTISWTSPTTPRSEYSKIGAFGSLLMATIVPEPCMPTLCWIAPDMPQAM